MLLLLFTCSYDDVASYIQKDVMAINEIINYVQSLLIVHHLYMLWFGLDTERATRSSSGPPAKAAWG